jgi:signal transduction histidine kinase
LPSAFVIIALLALLLVPLGVQERLEYLRAEIDQIGEPARDLVAELQYLLARESSARRGYLITGEAEFLDRYEQFSGREREIYPQLVTYAELLGPEVLREVTQLQALADRWREVRAPLETGGQPANAALMLAEQDLYLGTLEAAGNVDLALRGAIAERDSEIRGVEQLTQTIYSLLLVLALGAALAVSFLHFRVRRLASEATARTAEAAHALDETARAVEARAHLIRGFTHDVKNPLGAADGYADLLEIGVRGELTDGQAEIIGKIRGSIGTAIEIIDELLDLSRLESGGLNLVREQTDVDDLVAENVKRHRAAAEAAGLELTLEKSGPGQPAVAYTDPNRVMQILGNLVSNALKYTPAPGAVKVRVSRVTGDGAPHEGSWIAVSVEDTGPGIPPGELERIFDEFHRVPGSAGQGHGLGLAISRGVARLLGGDVTVRSTLGRGSEFRLWIPVRQEVVDSSGEAERLYALVQRSLKEPPGG